MNATSSSTTIIPSSALNPSGKSQLTILVVGDSGVGKTSLISSLVSENFNDKCPPVLQPVMVPPSLLPEQIPLTIIDTSSDPHHLDEILMHLTPTHSTINTSSLLNSKANLLADAILLVVSADQPDSLSRVEQYWLPLFESQPRPASGRIPIVLAINKSAQEDGTGTAVSAAVRALNMEMDQSYSSLPPTAAMSSHATVLSFQHLVHSFRLSAVLPCSAKYMYNLSRIFFACTKVVLSPIEPLFDLYGTSKLQPATMKFKILTQQALLRIFRLFDKDKDGVLSFIELDELHQVNFKGKKLSASAFEQLLRLLVAQGAHKEYVRVVNTFGSSPTRGVTFAGLLFFHYSFLMKDHHLWNTWYLLHSFGYQIAPTPIHHAPTHSSSSSSGGGLAIPSLGRGSSGISSSSMQASMPPLGCIVLRDRDYCTLGFPFQPQCAYELTPIGIDFLTTLFHTFDSDRDGLLSIRSGGNDVHNPGQFHVPPPSSQHPTRSSSGAANAGSIAAAAASASSSICSLAANSDLENMFLTCPDLPFSLTTFSKFVSASNKGVNYLTLDAWLSCWVLLLYNYSTVHPSLHTGHSSSLTSININSSHPSSITSSITPPNPDIILRYFAYLCFPVVPAYPPFTHLSSDELRRQTYRLGLPTGTTTSSTTTRSYLPKLARCIHLTPRNPSVRTSVESAQTANETILSTDPGLTPTMIHSHLSASANLKPKTVCCYVIGAKGAGKTSFIECLLGIQPSATAMAQAAALPNIIPGINSQQKSLSASSTAQQAESTTSATSSVDPSTSSSSSTIQHQQARTYANRLPLTHIPSLSTLSNMAAFGVEPTSTSSTTNGSSTHSTLTEPNRFLILKDIPSKTAGALLATLASPPDASSNSDKSSSSASLPCHLILLLYDGTSVESLLFVKERLHQCFTLQLPVLVIQTHVDCGNCRLLRTDFLGLDYSIPMEVFSSKIFWHAIQSPVSATSNNKHMVQIFERIHQAATQASVRRLGAEFMKGPSYVLTSLSLAARRRQRMRDIFLGVVVTGALILGGFALNLAIERKMIVWPIISGTSAEGGGSITDSISSASITKEPSSTIETSSASSITPNPIDSSATNKTT